MISFQRAMRLLCFVSIAWMFSVSCMAQAKAVVAEPVKDLGDRYKDEKPTHDFIIRNDGNTALVISEVKPSCGCTAASFDKNIAPGKTGKVSVVMDLSAQNGPISKGITVLTNDPDKPMVELAVRAKVLNHITASPGYARFILVKGETGAVTMHLYSEKAEAFDITGVESPIKGLEVTYAEASTSERKSLFSGKQWVVRMKMTSEAEVGPISDYVIIKTSHPKQKTVQIPVSGMVRAVVAATPPNVNLGKIELTTALSKMINIRNFATESVKLSTITTDIKGMTFHLEPLQEGREWQLKITMNPGMSYGSFSGKVQIQTDNKLQPVVVIEVKGEVVRPM